MPPLLLSFELVRSKICLALCAKVAVVMAAPVSRVRSILLKFIVCMSLAGWHSLKHRIGFALSKNIPPMRVSMRMRPLGKRKRDSAAIIL